MNSVIEEVMDAEVAAEVVMPTEQQKFAASLRELAKFYDEHPDLDTPSYNSSMTVYSPSKAQIAMFARAFGKAEKAYDNDSFRLIKDFGNGIVLQTYSSREAVCKRVKVGEEIVPAHVIPAKPAEDERIIEESVREIFEWECGSILGGDDDASK